jgi:hypothetical protein
VKQKRVERVERRRRLIEINLSAEARTGPTNLARRGCALFGSGVLLAAAAAALLGLH